MKRVLKKVLVCILIIFILNNFIISGISSNYLVIYAAEEEEEEEGGFDIEEKLNSFFGTVVGLLTWPLRVVALSIALGLDKLMSAVAYIETNNDGEEDSIFSASLTPFDILFNTTDEPKIQLLDINFFHIDSSNEDSIVFKFRTSIAVWYYVLRNLAAAILLVVLIYVGIRMTLTNVTPEQKANYKKMLVDWIVSLAIIFLVQYIMLFVINVNDAIVNAIYKVANNDSMEESLDKLGAYAFESQSVQAIAATVAYCMLIFQTFALFISYFNRMLTLAFLTIISPLITLTYSIDKMGDGKAQALNTWLKEYIFTILIQPFHCIIYMTFISVAINILGDNRDSPMKAIAAAIIAVLCINFIRDAEKLVRKIFAFGENGKSGSLASGLVIASAATGKAKNLGKSSVKAVNSVKNGFSRTKNTLSNARLEAVAFHRYMKGNSRDENGNQKSFEEIRSDVKTERDNAKADKIERKYGVKGGADAEYDKLVNTQMNALIASGMDAKRAKAQARLQVAKMKRTDRSKPRKAIKSARSTVRKAKSALRKSETLKELGGLAKAYTAAGAGLAFGAGYYGTTGEVGKGMLLGTAMYKGVGEALKSTKGTLRNDVNDRLQSLGMKDANNVAVTLNNVLADPDKYENEDELKKIIDEIKEALKKAGMEDKADAISTHIRNNVNKEIARNPSASIDSIVTKALGDTANQFGRGLTDVQKNALLNDTDIAGKANDFATFKQEQGIYNSIKDAGDLGISPDRFVENILKDYSGDISGNSTVTSEKFIEDSAAKTENNPNKENISVAPDDQEAKDFIEDKSYAEIKAFYRKCESEIARIQSMIAQAQSSMTDPAIIASLQKNGQAQINQIIAAKAKVQDTVLDREVQRLNSEYAQAMQKALSATTEDAKREVDQQLSNLQKQYDMYISEANMKIDRSNITGVKNEAEIMSQKGQLENERNSIRAARRNLR